MIDFKVRDTRPVGRSRYPTLHKIALLGLLFVVFLFCNACLVFITYGPQPTGDHHVDAIPLATAGDNDPHIDPGPTLNKNRKQHDRPAAPGPVVSLLETMCSQHKSVHAAVSEGEDLPLTTPFLPTHDTETYRLPRVSNGPLGTPLPRVSLFPTHKAEGVMQATLCAEPHNPLRVFVLLAEGQGNASQILENQVRVLTVPSSELLREVLVVAVAVSSEGNSKPVQLLVGASRVWSRNNKEASAPFRSQAQPLANAASNSVHNGTRDPAALGAWLRDATSYLETVVPVGASVPLGVDGQLSALMRNRSALLAEIARHASPTSSATSRALLTMPPHFVFEMPAGAVFRGRNLAALCRYEPVANDESEARAVYPYAAAPFAYKGGAERLPLGFVLPAASAWARGVTVAGTSPPLVVVSSCRPPVRVVAPAVDSRHYSKGGDVVLRGAARMVYVREADAFIPFFGGVHEDVILGRAGASAEGDGAAMAMSLGAREALFAMRRPLGSRCSSDPADPTRVVSFMPFFVDERRLATPHNDYRIFSRVLNATALMTAYSDVVVTTNVRAELAMAVVRATARGVAVADYVSSPELREADASVAFDGHYPNAHGEVVIVDYSAANRGHVLAGLAQYHIIAAKGFYDIVRYSEEDVYITRDQFLLYCATLNFLEKSNAFLNFLRFEFNATERDVGNEYDVLHAYAPDKYFFSDTGLVGVVDVPPRKWPWKRPPSAMRVLLKEERRKVVLSEGFDHSAFQVKPFK